MKCESQKICTQSRNQSGFTMIELMVTIIVLMVLSSIALPAYQSFIAGQRIKSASFNLIASLFMARSEALKRNTNVDVTPINGNWANGWTISAGSTTLKKESSLGNGMSVACYSGTTLSASCQKVTYINRGRLLPGSIAPSIQIASVGSNSTASRCVSIDPSGRPNSKKSKCV